MRLTGARLHQVALRQRVITAYRETCAIRGENLNGFFFGATEREYAMARRSATSTYSRS